MSHRFDSGLDRAQRRTIREAVIAQLGQLVVATLPEANDEGAAEDKFVVAVAPLPAPITSFEDGDQGDFFRKAVDGRSPVICVALGDRAFNRTDMDGKQWLGALDVHVYVASSHRRSLMDRLAGDLVADDDDSKDPGLEVTCEHVFERLAGWPLPTARAQELVAVKEEFAWVADDFTVMELLFTTKVTTVTNPNRDRTVLVEVLETTHTDVVSGDPSDVVHETELAAP